MHGPQGRFYILPGGGQRAGETLRQTVMRECREEVGIDVEVGAMLFVREYIGANHGFAPEHEGFHQIEVVFEAACVAPDEACLGAEKDPRQVGIAWLRLSELAHEPFYPELLKQYFQEDRLKVPHGYLGDIN